MAAGDLTIYFQELSDRINDDLNAIVSTEFPPNLYNPMHYVLASRGKRFRPVLLIMACESVGGSVDDAYYAALAIEILHNFTLVHDDIMDNDDLRRGRMTVHKKWNESIAILAGDGLIALAYRYLLRTRTRSLRRITKIFSEAIIKICEGQSLDKDMELLCDVSLDDYLEMIERKTGVLIAISAELGGILGRGSEKQVRALTKFGLDLGIAFQIQDDLLDIVSEEVVIGKDIGSDIAQGKKTFPIILFMKTASEKDAAFVRETLHNRGASAGDVRRVRDLLNGYGIIEATQREINRWVDRANEYVASLPGSVDTTRLLFLSSLIRNRVS